MQRFPNGAALHCPGPNAIVAFVYVILFFQTIYVHFNRLSRTLHAKYSQFNACAEQNNEMNKMGHCRMYPYIVKLIVRLNILITSTHYKNLTSYIYRYIKLLYVHSTVQVRLN